MEKTTPAYWIDNAAEAYESVDNDNKVITIATAAQLAKLAKDIKDNDTGAGGTSTFKYLGYTFKLTADIDLGGKIWTPIGADLASPYSCTFRGTFDGNNHTISNMNAVHNEYAGLFGPLHSGYQLPIIIKDLTIKDFVVESNHFAGGIAAWFNRGGDLMSITNCSVIDGTITSSPELLGTNWDNGDKVGGICGYVFDGEQLLTIKRNTVSKVNITAYRDFGGLIGAADGLEVTENTISDVNLYQNNTNAYKPDAITTYDAVVGKEIANKKACNIHDNTVTNVKKYTGTPGAYTEVQ